MQVAVNTAHVAPKSLINGIAAVLRTARDRDETKIPLDAFAESQLIGKPVTIEGSERNVGKIDAVQKKNKYVFITASVYVAPDFEFKGLALRWTARKDRNGRLHCWGVKIKDVVLCDNPPHPKTVVTLIEQVPWCTACLEFHNPPLCILRKGLPY